MAHRTRTTQWSPQSPGGPVISTLRRFAALAVLLVAATSCGDPTTPPPAAEPEPEAETVGPEGGTAVTNDGEASLSVPAGALAAPVEIKVSAATVTDMLDRVPAGEYDPVLGTVFGVAPIAGTIWDLQPDGLEFLTPATIVLRYEESALPEGVSENDLGVFVINGVFEQLQSTVDTEANTITAEIGHFSFAFTGPIPGHRIDLELTSLSASTDPQVGVPVEYTAGVRNNGPGPAAGARVIYVVSGNTLLGDVGDSCAELPESGPGALALSCSLPSLLPGELGSAAPVQVIPQEAGETVMVQATAAVAARDTELNPENDTQAVAGSVVGDGAMVDLQSGQPRISSASDPRVGGLMEVIGRVDNLGSSASSGGTMLLEAIGDVEMGAVPTGCTEIDPVAPVTAAVECPVDPLEPYDIDAVGPIPLTPLSAGEVQIVATVTPAAADTDVNPENDVNTRTWEIASTYLVDLEPVSPFMLGPVRQAGAPLTAQIRVGNYLPPSNGGTVIYEATGDVTLGQVADGCTEASHPSGVSVVCTFDAFLGYVNDTRGPGGETIRGWVGPFEVIPQSVGVVTFAATTVPVEGDTDVNPDNDRLEQEVQIGGE